MDDIINGDDDAGDVKDKDEGDSNEDEIEEEIKEDNIIKISNKKHNI